MCEAGSPAEAEIVERCQLTVAPHSYTHAHTGTQAHEHRPTEQRAMAGMRACNDRTRYNLTIHIVIHKANRISQQWACDKCAQHNNTKFYLFIIIFKQTHSSDERAQGSCLVRERVQSRSFNGSLGLGNASTLNTSEMVFCVLFVSRHRLSSDSLTHGHIDPVHVCVRTVRVMCVALILLSQFIDISFRMRHTNRFASIYYGSLTIRRGLRFAA